MAHLSLILSLISYLCEPREYKMLNNREQYIVDFIKEKGVCSSKEIFDGADLSISYRAF